MVDVCAEVQGCASLGTQVILLLPMGVILIHTHVLFLSTEK